MAQWKQSRISLLPVPSDLGVWTNVQDGVAEAPAYLLAERPGGLKEELQDNGWKLCNGHAIRIPARPRPGGAFPPNNKVEVYEVCLQVADAVEAALEAGDLPLILGGDHSIAIGSIAGLVRFYMRRGRRIGVIWMDAHPDMNTPGTSPTQNIHGMPLSCCVQLAPEDIEDLATLGKLSELVSPKVLGQNVCLFGTRDIDLGKHGQRGEDHVMAGASVHERKVHRTTMPVEAQRLMTEAVSIATSNTDGFHLSFDIDFLDSEFAPAAGTPFGNGASVEAALAALEVVRDSGKLLSVDLVEIHPRMEGAEKTRSQAIDFLVHLLKR